MSRTVRVVISFLLTLFYGSLVLIATACRLCRHGKKYLKVKRREAPPPCLQDNNLGSHSYVQLKDIKLHYVSKGDRNKEMMLFIHGFPEFWFSWRYQLKEFSKDYWAVAVDMRGYGNSDKPPGEKNYDMVLLVNDMRDVILALGKSQAIVVAHDWGGIIGWTLSMKYPDVVSKLVILNAPHPNNYTEVVESSFKQFLKSWYVFFFQLPYLPEFVLRGNDLAAIADAFQKNGNMCCTDEEVEAYKYIFSNPGAFTPPLNYYRANFGARINQTDNKPQRVTAPTLIVWGNNDVALSTRLATECAKLVDIISVRIIEGGSHWIQMDRPEEVNAHIKEFLKKFS